MTTKRTVWVNGLWGAALMATAAAGCGSGDDYGEGGLPDDESGDVGGELEVARTALATLGSTDVLSDDFQDGNMNGWSVVDQGTLSAPSTWGVVAGEVQQSSNIYGPSVSATSGRRGTFAHYTGAGASSWTSYSLNATLRSTDDDGIGVMFRYTNANNYYKVDLDRERNFRKLFKVVNGVETTLATASGGYTQNANFALNVSVIGDKIQVLLNGADIFGGRITDGSLAAGSVALYCWGNQNCYFDNVSVQGVQSGSAFTIAVIPDTQVYAKDFPLIFSAQTQWIAANWQTRGIKMAIHEGDITNNNNTPQWQAAQNAMRLMDGIVPYTMLPGNHDMGTNGSSDTRDTTLYNDYFPLSHYSSRPTFGGVYPGEPTRYDNNYHTFSAGGMNWLVLSLEFGPRDPVLDWANQVVAAHPNHRVIVATHTYMFYDETRHGAGENWNPHQYGVASGPGGVNDGDEMWDKFVKLHRNIVMVLNGHVLSDGQGRMVSTGIHGNKVYQMLANYQMQTNGGNGYLRLLEIDPSNGTLRGRSYSPYLNEYKTDWQNDFLYANVDLNPPVSTSLLNDGFSDGNLTGWSIVDQGTHSAPSAWSVTGGRARQASNIYGPASSAVSGRKGTYAWYNDAAALGWSNYRLDAVLNSTDDDGIGVMFYYQNANNYYKVDIDGERNFRKLFKMKNGVETTLATSAGTYSTGANISLRVQVVNGSITVTLDGSSLFGTVMDSGLAGGSVAMYCWGNQDCYFDDVAVNQ